MNYPSDWRRFEEHARAFLSEQWNVELAPRKVLVGGYVEWNFDLVSPDHSIVGDAKWLTNSKNPAAKLSGLAKYVWLLQRVDAERRFLVFGQDPKVAERFLKRLAGLCEGVEFYYLGPNGLSNLL